MVNNQPKAKQNTPAQTIPEGDRPMVRAYWPRYRREAWTMTILVQLTIVTAIALALMIAGLHPTTPIFLIVIVSVALLTIALNLMLTNIVLAPLRDLSAALTHVSGEPTNVTPPNPSATHFERDGLKPLLDLIYQTAAASHSTTTPTANDSHEQLLTTAFAHGSSSIVIMNGNGRIQYASPNAPVVTDSDGNQSLQLIFEADQSFDQWRAATTGHLVRAETSWQRIANRLASDPKRRIFDITASYEQGHDDEIVVLFFDRTDSYQPEEDQLDFISFAAHELRGPVTVIRGYLDVLSHELGEQISPTHRALIDRLTVSANRLSTYINNILNASRYDRRHLKIHLSERRLIDVYHMIADDMDLRASTQNRLLSVSIPADLPTIAADPSSLSEVLANLIDNALKYSHEGGAVGVTANADEHSVYVSVIDQGIGMPSNVVSNLFHKFYRSHRSRETVAGTGIGLYICKAIVESHGGMIEVKSEEGRGSTFTFTLPIYATIADKLAANNNTNEGLTPSGNGGWIKNHAKIRG